MSWSMSKLPQANETCCYELEKAGTLLKLKNSGDRHLDTNFACVSAPEMVKVEVRIDGRLHDCVYAQASHSWWTLAGGKLFDHNGIAPGETIEITADGACALRIDWT